MACICYSIWLSSALASGFYMDFIWLRYGFGMLFIWLLYGCLHALLYGFTFLLYLADLWRSQAVRHGIVVLSYVGTTCYVIWLLYMPLDRDQ